jgi:Recombination endonuclease VII
MKQCKKCGAVKALTEYYSAAGNGDGLRGECKECSLAQRRRWYQDNRERSMAYVRAWQQASPDRVRAWRRKNRARRLEKLREIHLRNKFGLTPDEYDRMLVAQGGVCALCDALPTPGISLHVDHDHGTGEIRGLLCVRCNNALGLFREDPDLLKRAARYVAADSKHRSQRSNWERLARERALALRGRAA